MADKIIPDSPELSTQVHDALEQIAWQNPEVAQASAEFMANLEAIRRIVDKNLLPLDVKRTIRGHLLKMESSKNSELLHLSRACTAAYLNNTLPGVLRTLADAIESEEGGRGMKGDSVVLTGREWKEIRCFADRLSDLLILKQHVTTDPGAAFVALLEHIVGPFNATVESINERDREGGGA